ncbi:MAG: iron chaperone [Bryobacteraceae bacterium]
MLSLLEPIRAVSQQSRAIIPSVPLPVQNRRGHGAIMAKTGFKSVDAYISSQPEAAQPILERVREAIRDAVPRADEVISYQIPTYKLRGDAVLYFAGWKQHYSLYPATERVVSEFKDELASRQVHKGTIRFPLSEPVPVKLIGRIAKFRAKEVAGRQKTKAAAPKKSKAG